MAVQDWTRTSGSALITAGFCSGFPPGKQSVDWVFAPGTKLPASERRTSVVGGGDRPPCRVERFTDLHPPEGVTFLTAPLKAGGTSDVLT